MVRLMIERFIESKYLRFLLVQRVQNFVGLKSPSLTLPEGGEQSRRQRRSRLLPLGGGWEGAFLNRQNFTYSILLGIVALLLAACGGPEIQPLQPGAVPWPTTEQSTYAITDIDGNPAGTAIFRWQAGAATIEEDGWTLRREILAQGDQEVLVVEVTARGLRPRLSTLVRLRSSGREQVNTTYTNGQVDMELTTAQDVKTTYRENVVSDARDYRTLMQLARMLPLEPGYATQVNSYLPVTNILERFTIAVTAEEVVTVPAGSFETYRVRFSTGETESTAWIEVAAPHRLIKFVEGRNGGTFELQAYQTGDS